MSDVLFQQSHKLHLSFSFIEKCTVDDCKYCSNFHITLPHQVALQLQTSTRSTMTGNYTMKAVKGYMREDSITKVKKNYLTWPWLKQRLITWIHLHHHFLCVQSRTEGAHCQEK